VIVVEDEPDVARLQQTILEDAGATVTLITSDFQCTLRAETWLGVDVAVIDLMLPDLDGEDICRYLIQDQPQVRRVVCTAKPITQLVDVQVLAHVVVQKPFRPEDLIHAVMAGTPSG
jgi:two-component system alkaline phosphatase synthesis response regulator PhoP